MRFTLASILAGVAWWAIGLTIVPDIFLRRSPTSLIVVLVTALLTAWLSRPFYRGSAGHLAWLTPVSVYFAAAVFGYLLPLTTERLYVLERCLEMVRAMMASATFTAFGLLVFPAAFLTHWLLRRMARSDAPVRVEIPIEQETRPATTPTSTRPARRRDSGQSGR